MDLPGSSLFNGGSLHFDGLAIEPGAPGGAEEEAEAAEEEERRNQELQNVLKDAFDDLIEDEDEESTIDHTDPSFHPEKYPTSTPFIAGKERSLYDELGGQYDLPRMSYPGAAYNPDSDGYHGNRAGDYRDDPAGGYHDDPAGGYHDDPAGGYLGDPAGGYHGDHGAGFHSDGEYDAQRDAEDVSEFRTLQPEETNAGLTEIVNTPRQHLDTSATDSSAAHYRHCYTSPRSDLAAATAAAAGGDDAGSGDADDVSSGNMIEMGLRAHQEQGDWPSAAGRPPERTAFADRPGDVLDPGKYVANKQKDYILARTSRDQLETLNEARGHEISRLRSELDRQRTDSAAELRSCQHQATLATADGQGLQTSLQQARHLLVEKEDKLMKLTGEIDSLKIQLQASEEVNKECASRQQSSECASRQQSSEVTVQSLQAELTELRRSEALARNTERHQQLVDGLQRRHQAELADRQQQLDLLKAQLESQTDLAVSLQTQLVDSEQARHRLAADKGDVINQLTAGLEAAQSRCRQLMQGDTAQLRERLAQEEEQRKQLQLQLAASQDQLSSLQRDLDACESVLRLGGRDDTMPDDGQLGLTATPQSTPSQSTPGTRPTSGSEPTPFSLRRELMRAMENTRSRREEVGRLRTGLDQARDHLRTTSAQLAEKDAQLAAARDQARQQPPPADQQRQQQQQQRRLDELELQLATEQKQRRLLEDQLRKIKAEGEKVHKTAEELRRHMSEQLEQADRDKLEAVEEVRTACLQLHDDMMDKLRTEKVEEYETELATLRSELTQAQEELNEVKELYVKVCQEKDQFEQETEAAREAAVREQERALKTALDHHYDKWYTDWRHNQQTAVAEAVEAERLRHISEVASAGMQTEPPVPHSAHSTQTTPPPPPPPTRDGAVQVDDHQTTEQLDKLKKRLKRACLEKKKLETDAKELHEQIKNAASEHEERMKKERQEADRKVREARRRSSSSADSELVKTLRQELEDTHAQLRKLTEQTCTEKNDLIVTYESRLREALEQDRRVAAAMVTSQRRQLTAGQLTAECDRLRGELERLRANHESQLKQSEHDYQQGLASYRQLIETNVAELTKAEEELRREVAELTKAEEELRREAAATGQVLKEENARLTAESATLAESYDALLAQRQQDRQNFEQQIRQLSAESAGGDRDLRVRVAELESRLQQLDADNDHLRDKLRQGKEKLRNYHGYVKEREQHYDAEFRRLEAEYRVAVGKMKEKVMLARDGGARSRPLRAAAVTQTEVSGEELVRVLQDMSGFQRTVGQLRLELTQVVQRCGQPQPPPPPGAARWKDAPPPPVDVPGAARWKDAPPPPVDVPGAPRWKDAPPPPVDVPGAPRWKDAPPPPVAVSADPRWKDAPPPPVAVSADPSTYRSHTLDRRRPEQLTDRPNREPLPAAGEPRVPGWPDYGALSSLGRPDSGGGGGLTTRGISPLLTAAENPMASLERIRRDLNYIFPREPAVGGGHRSSSAEEMLARLARLPLTPPSRDGERIN